MNAAFIALSLPLVTVALPAAAIEIPPEQNRPPAGHGDVPPAGSWRRLRVRAGPSGAHPSMEPRRSGTPRR